MAKSSATINKKKNNQKMNLRTNYFLLLIHSNDFVYSFTINQKICSQSIKKENMKSETLTSSFLILDSPIKDSFTILG
uniref:Uncharacterized protein n=1 Tax=Tetranychus urticae TaxID=32264 RepID=T1KMX3_TETUR